MNTYVATSLASDPDQIELEASSVFEAGRLAMDFGLAPCTLSGDTLPLRVLVTRDGAMRRIIESIAQRELE